MKKVFVFLITWSCLAGCKATSVTPPSQPARNPSISDLSNSPAAGTATPSTNLVCDGYDMYSQGGFHYEIQIDNAQAKTHFFENGQHGIQEESRSTPWSASEVKNGEFEVPSSFAGARSFIHEASPNNWVITFRDATTGSKLAGWLDLFWCGSPKYNYSFPFRTSRALITTPPSQSANFYDKSSGVIIAEIPYFGYILTSEPFELPDSRIIFGTNTVQNESFCKDQGSSSSHCFGLLVADWNGARSQYITLPEKSRTFDDTYEVVRFSMNAAGNVVALRQLTKTWACDEVEISLSNWAVVSERIVRCP